MKKRILSYLLGAFLITLLMIYFALKPIIPNPFGWNPLPEVSVQKQSIAQDEWAMPIKIAQDTLARWQKKLSAPSLSVAVGHNNQILWSEAIGYADIPSGQLANDLTVYRIGSISKSVTAVALATLMDKNLLQTDDQLTTLLPDYELANATISVKQLASHTAGIRHYDPCWCMPIVKEAFSNQRYTSIKEATRIFSQDALKFDPGTSFNYSTYGYTLLAGVIESVSQTSFLDYLQKAVLNTLDMQATHAGGTGKVIPNKASFYQVKDGQYKKVVPMNISNKWAGGGLLSTPADLVKMGNALLDSTFLSETTKAQLFTPIPLNDGTMNPQNYAMGWRVDTSKRVYPTKEIKIIHHDGTISGGIALIILFPEYDLTVALMTNRSGSSRELFTPLYEIVKPFMEKVEEAS